MWIFALALAAEPPPLPEVVPKLPVDVCVAPATERPEMYATTDVPGPDDVVLRLHRLAPVRCNDGQTNTPCVIHKAEQCVVRTANCDQKPCTEGDRQPVACDCARAGLEKPEPVCLLIDETKPTNFRVFYEQGFSEHGIGPIEGAVKLCGEADRPWRVEVNVRNEARFEAMIDWTKGRCQTLDLAQRTVSDSCDPAFAGRTFDHGL